MEWISSGLIFQRSIVLLIQSTFSIPPRVQVATPCGETQDPREFPVLHQGLAADHGAMPSSPTCPQAPPDARCLRATAMPWVRCPANRAGSDRLGRWPTPRDCRGRGHPRCVVPVSQVILPAFEQKICRNFSAFFRRMDRHGFHLAWEPRGEGWTEEIVGDLCAEYNLIHCVDPFRSALPPRKTRLLASAWARILRLSIHR